jgi:RNA polymerase sigma-70 factor (ECF subfamily)
VNAVERAFREEWGRVVAALIRRTGDWDLAEECAQEAFAEALRRWPAEGVPRVPGAWLTTVAANRATDRLRRARRGSELLQAVGRDPLLRPADPAREDAMEDESGIEDDRLRLIFTCCHPALALEARVALTLRTLAGLSTAEIARAFLVPEATMAKRLTRAKAKIAQAGIPYRVPPAHLLPERTGGVLAVLYLLFNEGYAASAGEALIRGRLCAEAIRLGRVLAALMPDEPEAVALLGLMLLHDARRESRMGPDGEVVTLEDQDRERWDWDAIREGRRLVIRALQRADPGPYALQAAIAACHTEPSVDWEEVRQLYDLLAAVLPSPVVRLNRAVAVAMAGDLEGALRELDDLRLPGYHLLPATRADLLRRQGDHAAAAAAYRQALAENPPEAQRRFLLRRLAEVSADPA